MVEEKETKKVLTVDAEACIGCGTCESIASKYFKVVDGVCEVQKNTVAEEDAEVVEDAINNCPVQAISYSKAEVEESK